ncbi:MAG TPA: PH domain-containing protein [Streptosporangiaceae bacterium]|nr:PH domain-containing protein [Streptosporangiaceae bacterium]
MANDGGLSAGEFLVLRLHPHWKTVLAPFLVLALIIAAVLVLLTVLPSSADTAVVRLAIAVVALLAAIAWCAVPLLRWRTTSYELTNRRLRLRSGILTRTGRDFPLARISDVSFSLGVLDRILGSGRLVVESAGEHGELVLTEIPHVEEVQAELFQLVEGERTRLERPLG